MHKKLATQISIFLISILFSLFLFSCAEPNNPSADYKTELQNSMSGTWHLETYEEYAKGNNTIWPYPYGSPETIEISNEYIKFDNYDVSKWEFPSGTRLVEDMINIYNNPNCSGRSKELFFKILNEYQIYKKSDLCMYKYIAPCLVQDYCYIKSFCILSLVDDKLYLLRYDDIDPSRSYYKYYQCIYTQEKKDNSNNDNNNNDNPSDNIYITGSYTISEANGSTFTFATDGTWTYKYNSSTSEGTWTFADGELTITYSLGGYSNTAVFTVSVSDGTYTLTGKSGDTTTIIASAFKITNQESLENGIVTLVKQ